MTNNLHVHKRDCSTGYAIRSWTYYTYNRGENGERGEIYDFLYIVFLLFG